MIKEVIYYEGHCDNCGTQWSSYDGICAKNEKFSIEDDLMDSDWHKTGDNTHYCPHCYSFDDNDQLLLNHSRVSMKHNP